MPLFRPLFAAVPLLLAATGCSTVQMPGAAPMAVVSTAASPGAAATAGKTEVTWLGQASIRVRTPAGLNSALTALGVLPENLSPRFGKGGTVAPFGPSGPKITAVRAEHSSEYQWKNPATGKNEIIPGGEPVGFILEMENGFRIWHMGDTGVFGDMRLIADMYRPDLVLIPIGGHFVMNPVDAAMATRDMIRPRYALPIHYGTLPVLRGTPAEYKAALGSAPVQMLAVEPGQKVEF